ncbi:MAG: DUF5908 family protein [Solitalea sp.]
MPIEIKELHIKAVVAARQSRPPAWNGLGARNERDKLKKELVKECIEKILQLLDDKKER